MCQPWKCRASHVFLFITDTAVNVSPAVSDKRDIVQNAIDLAHALGLQEPKVAILSAQETLSPKLESSFDAAVLCKMADRGQITGGVLDGPLGYDVAVSAAAETKKIASPIAGKADILVVQDLEAGTMLVKLLQYMSDAEVADLVIGARVPVIVSSRTNTMLARLASCAWALLSVRHWQVSPSSSRPAGSMNRCRNRGVRRPRRSRWRRVSLSHIKKTHPPHQYLGVRW